MSSPASAWQRPGFRQLTRGWLVANVADAALFLMMAAWIKDLTGSDQAAAGVFVAIGLPSLIAPSSARLQTERPESASSCGPVW